MSRSRNHRSNRHRSFANRCCCTPFSMACGKGVRFVSWQCPTFGKAEELGDQWKRWDVDFWEQKGAKICVLELGSWLLMYLGGRETMHLKGARISSPRCKLMQGIPVSQCNLLQPSNYISSVSSITESQTVMKTPQRWLHGVLQNFS